MSRRKYEVEVYKQGRKRFGEFRTLPDGRRCYLSYRNHESMYRGNGRKTISGARRDNCAAWGFDNDVLLMLRRQEIEFVGVLVKETKDIYMTRLGIINEKGFTRINRRGELMRFLNLHWFIYKPGKISLRK